MNAQVKMDKTEIQALIEEKFSKRNIRSRIKKELMEVEGIEAVLDMGEAALNDYASKEYSYDSKNIRVRELFNYDLREIVTEVLIIMAKLDRPTKFTNLVGQVGESLHFTNKADGAKCAAEILAILQVLGVYEIFKEEKYSEMLVESFVTPSEELQTFIQQTKFLPPMICKPKELKTNNDTAYMTRREPLILGGHVNFHEEDICLDSLNAFNRIPLTLNTSMLSKYSEEPTNKVKNDPEKYEQWQAMVADSYQTYLDLVRQGNHFYQTHGVDKRGRTYARGYHVSTQGNSFRKAILDFAEQEVVEGI
jgi:hypothetical protein